MKYDPHLLSQAINDVQVKILAAENTIITAGAHSHQGVMDEAAKFFDRFSKEIEEIRKVIDTAREMSRYERDTKV